MIAADEEPLTSYRAPFLVAVVTVLGFVATFGGWAMYARLDSAVTTQGVLLAESQKKTVNHLEGGILDKLLVQAGDRVTEGQVVALLDATQVRAQLAQLESQRKASSFDIWRLEAEEANAAALDPATAPEPDTAQIAAQTALFAARQRAHEAQVASLRREIDQLRAQVVASNAQAESADRQLASWTEQRALSAKLVETGATPRQKLMEIDRTIASLEGERDAQRGMAAAATESIAKSGKDIETLEQQRLVDIGQSLSDARRQVDSLASQIVAAKNVVERSELRAPQAGVVVHIYIVSPGAVVPSGQPVMDIVPDEDPLVVETRLPPEAIDTVRVGRAAQVRLTAYPRANAPVLTGEVTYVSADLLTDARDGSSYFDARVSLDRSSLASRPDVTLTSGMPVEVSIQTGERRAGDYFIQPIARRLGHAMREE
ncbi:MAG: HlyD family type I secretion periplasmic adaptor subunit [Amaricoccus sp.]